VDENINRIKDEIDYLQICYHCIGYLDITHTEKNTESYPQYNNIFEFYKDMLYDLDDYIIFDTEEDKEYIRRFYDLNNHEYRCQNK